MLDDQVLVKRVREATRNVLVVEGYGNQYVISNSHWLFLVDWRWPKTMKELAGLFEGLPGDGERKQIRNKELSEGGFDLVRVYNDFIQNNYANILSNTGFIHESLSDGKKVTYERILSSGDYATLVDDKYYQIVKNCELRNNGYADAIAVFNQEQCIGIVMPLKGREENINSICNHIAMALPVIEHATV